MVASCGRQDAAAPAPAAAAPPSSRLAELLRDDGTASHRLALRPRPFSFPADHGPHHEYRNEWWYFTGNLSTAEERRFGYELTVFRFSLEPGDAPLVSPASAWRSDEVYIGHFAVTDVRNEDFHVAERYARAALGLAGATAAPFRVWVEDWSISAQAPTARRSASRWILRASDDGMAVELELSPQKPPVPNGVDGLSRKSAEPGNASYYYSMPRWRTTGRLTVGGEELQVSGLSWLDREWGSSALAATQAGWDWFALQFDDGSDLMFYNLRRLDGSQDPFSAGTWVAKDGAGSYLSRDDVRLEVLDYWDSPVGGRYPMGWRVEVPSRGLAVRVEPVQAGQELAATVRYWEGAVDVAGTRHGVPLAGQGYVELTGYAD